MIVIYILDLHHHTRSWKAFICFASRAGHEPQLGTRALQSFSHTWTACVCVHLFFNYIFPRSERSGLRVNYGSPPRPRIYIYIYYTWRAHTRPGVDRPSSRRTLKYICLYTRRLYQLLDSAVSGEEVKSHSSVLLL